MCAYMYIDCGMVYHMYMRDRSVPFFQGNNFYKVLPPHCAQKHSSNKSRADHCAQKHSSTNSRADATSITRPSVPTSRIFIRSHAPRAVFVLLVAVVAVPLVAVPLVVVPLVVVPLVVVPLVVVVLLGGVQLVVDPALVFRHRFLSQPGRSSCSSIIIEERPRSRWIFCLCM